MMPARMGLPSVRQVSDAIEVLRERWAELRDQPPLTDINGEPQRPLPHSVRGITQQLAEYQVLAAKAGWDGTRDDAVRAMAAHPLVPSLTVAESLYDEMAVAQRAWLPERLLDVAPVRRPSR